jgi:hypothetical protein
MEIIGGEIVRKPYLFIFMLILLSSMLFAQNSSGIEVENNAICTSVEDRQPIGTDSVFTADAGKLYCFTKLKSQTDKSKISHVWFYQDNIMAKINLPIKAKSWRTWSAKTIMPDWKGNWRVEVQDSNGNILSSISFRLK